MRTKISAAPHDKTREFEYGAKSHIGNFSDALMTEATDKKWNVISMKDGWKTIFAFGNKLKSCSALNSTSGITRRLGGHAPHRHP